MSSIEKKKQQVYRDIEAGRFDVARQQLDKLVRRQPSDAQLHFLHGAVHGQLGNFGAAIESLGRAVSLNPADLEARANLGLACVKAGNYTQAIDVYLRLLTVSPRHPGAEFHLGYAYYQSGDISNALEYLGRSVKRDPGNVTAYVYLVKVQMSLGAPREALVTARQGLARDYRHTDLLLLSASLHMELGQVDEAGQVLDRLLEAEPDNLEGVVARAMLLENVGHFEDALAIIEPIIDTGKLHVGLAVAYSRIARQFGIREQAVEYIERVLAGLENLDSEAIGTLNYQLGKQKDALKHYDEAFEHFRVSNTLRPHVFDPVQYRETMNAQKRVYSHEYFARVTASEPNSVRPVFIVGMPRSGTTLVEQILASHPAVYGAGELPDIDNISRDIAASMRADIDYPACMEEVTGDILEVQRDRYIGSLRSFSSTAAYITDKMPHNFEHIGLIWTLFPGARIIHCIRNPLDTCLSIYFNDFNAGHGYATDLSMLGEHYNEYLLTMEHWRSVLPDSIHEVVYERIVEDLEASVRSMLDYCGLEWSPDCLEFYKNRRTVSTFSYDQVRKPIYTGSIGRWKHYERFLKPLQDALGTE